MTYLLIRSREIPESSHLRIDSIEVSVCSEDGTIYDPKFFCPTCTLRRDPE